MIKRLIIINYLNGKITYGVYNFNFYNLFPMGGHTSKTSFSYYLLLYNLRSLYLFIFVLKYTLIIVIIFFFFGFGFINSYHRERSFIYKIIRFRDHKD